MAKQKNKVGRPSTYSPEIVEKAKKYLNGGYKRDKGVVPTIFGLAVYLDKSRDTLYEWAKHPDRQEFSDILRKIEEKQATMLLGGGLSGEFNSTITKLMLTKHGFSDKEEIKVEGNLNLFKTKGFK